VLLAPDSPRFRNSVTNVYMKSIRSSAPPRARIIKITVHKGTGTLYAAEQSDNCGGTMKVISFIERHQSEVIEKILRHCGMWKETPPRAPPVEISFPSQKLAGPTLDYDFFSSLAS
jgi:hypothetical protein